MKTPNQKQWYEALFEHYSETYDNESYTQGTSGEVDFIEAEVNHDKSVRILDIGCGTGRHSVELAKRGYRVTGIDLSEEMLAKAVEKAENAKVSVQFQKADARDFSFPEKFDLALMLCEGAFPLMETDEMNYRILQNAFRSLADNGKFIFTTYNGLYPLYNSISEVAKDTIFEGQSAENKLDLMTFRMESTFEAADQNGVTRRYHCNERYYMPSEISWQLQSIGFRSPDIYAARLGAFSRADKLTVNDYEMLVIAQK
jgi:SAM-dependent methyltransferase